MRGIRKAFLRRCLHIFWSPEVGCILRKKNKIQGIIFIKFEIFQNLFNLFNNQNIKIFIKFEIFQNLFNLFNNQNKTLKYLIVGRKAALSERYPLQ